MREKNSYKEKEAIEKFENEAWPEVIKKSSEVLSKEIDIKKRILSQVANEFLQVIKIKDLICF